MTDNLQKSDLAEFAGLMAGALLAQRALQKIVHAAVITTAKSGELSTTKFAVACLTVCMAPPSPESVKRSIQLRKAARSLFSTKRPKGAAEVYLQLTEQEGHTDAR